MVTAGTYRKEHFFRSRLRLRFLHEQLMTLSDHYGWQLQAWALFSNHYHMIATSPEEGGGNLSKMLSHLHTVSARYVNGLDEAPARKVWHNYRDTPLTYEASYYARLHYVIENPVKHGLVTAADQYPWCSASWFATHSSPAFQNTVRSFKYDRIKIEDDY